MKTRSASIVRWLTGCLMLTVLLSALIVAACGSEPQVAEQGQRTNEEKAPSFELPEARGGMMSLAQLLEGRNGLALVFYRGFF
ncbi:MAG: hypothetical protein F4Y49_12300 [Dehalococcoidia bacterium]|nr:hypothetical protein [Dehalococcoidia bacterium]